MSNGSVEKLIEKGVDIPNPKMVTVGEEVDIDRISAEGVVLYPGSRIAGAETLILKDVRLGSGGPAAVENCWIGAGTELSSGVFQQAVFMGNNRIGPAAHIREGTILEEGAGAAHCVGLKQTILFPFVTLGSLVNFCDCLMAGGTGPRNHSEVGSSFVHFNFTPNQDKATPSLIGDVPRGVMLDRPPVFLGGQGGMVGPCRVAFGTVTASGTILRKDAPHENHLLFESPHRSFRAPHTPGLYRNVKRIVEGNLVYMANLKALEAWYHRFRSLFPADEMEKRLLDGLRSMLFENLRERIHRMSQFVDKLPASLDIYRKVMGKEASGNVVAQKAELMANWPSAAALLQRPAAEFESSRLQERFLTSAARERPPAAGYLQTVSELSAATRTAGTTWLQSVVDRVVSETKAVLRAQGPDAAAPGPGGRP